MSEQQSSWVNPHSEDLSGGTHSSQDTICSQDNTGYGTSTHPNNGRLQSSNNICDIPISLSDTDNVVYPMSESFQKNHGSDMNSSFDPSTTSSSFHRVDPSVFINEDTQMFPGGSIALESPYDITSPCEPGDISSPMEAMESDGINDNDDSTMFSSGTAGRRPFPPNWPDTFSTTTPGGSSDEDPYASSESRKKRRRTKKEPHIHSHQFSDDYIHHHSASSQIPSPISAIDIHAGDNINSDTMQDADSSLFGNSQSGFNSSDLSFQAGVTKGNRRSSNASESNLSTRENSLIESSKPSMSVDCAPCFTESRKKKYPRRANPSSNSALSLQANYPSSDNGCSLHILVQPEEQHRARYLTEGSRGPVRDSSQQGYPQLQLKGYSGKTSLHVYVGSDSEDKVRPHGFYQACKVTGRNTTQCDEVEIEGTKVLQIPFDARDVVSVDCVGVLKLRNADVEIRIGPNRAKKRSQTVRLIFRVILDDLPSSSPQNPCVLQVVSNRINCTQLRGLPEITKKSLERCSVEGGQEMFIIGRNFHRGINVIFQDPEKPDGSHWSEVGKIDRDTFNRAHMIVHIPPYHDKTITNPVSVQLCVEYNGRKCDPHSFTYDPILEPEKKDAANKEENNTKEEDTLQKILSSKENRKYLEALFAQLLRPSDSGPNDAKSEVLAASTATAKTSSELPKTTTLPTCEVPPVAFVSDGASLPSTIQKPIPMQSGTTAGPRAIIKPNTFGANNSSTGLGNFSLAQNPVVMTPQPFKSNPAQTSQAQLSLNQNLVLSNSQVGFQTSSSSVFGSVQVTSTTNNQNMAVKTEGPSILQGSFVAFPNTSQSQQLTSGMHSIPQTPHSGGNLVFSLSSGLNQVVTSQSQQTFQHPASQQTIQTESVTSQESIPAQENASTFALPQTGQWQAQIVNQSPDQPFCQSSIQSQTSMTVTENLFTPTLQPPISVPPSVMFTSDNLTQLNGNAVQVQISNLPTSEQMQTSPLDTSIALQNAVASSQPAVVNNQWQTVNTTNQINAGFVNEKPTGPVPLQHSSSGELVFSRKNSLQNNLSTSQPQFFSFGSSTELMNQPTSSTTLSPGDANLPHDNDAYSNILMVSLNSEGTSTGDHIQSNDTLSPTVLGDTGLSVGFDNNFSITDKVIDTIISDCTNNAPFASDESASHPHIDQSRLFQQQLCTTVPQQAIDHNSLSQVLVGDNQQTMSMPCKNMNTSASQFSSNDIEMAISHMEPSNKQFLHQPNEILAGSAVGMYLVNPNNVQPMVQDMMTHSSSHSTPMPTQQPGLMQIQQNDHVTSNNNIGVERSASTSNFPTIDGSILGLNSPNQVQFDQAFSEFNQTAKQDGET